MRPKSSLSHALEEAGRMAILGVEALGEMLAPPFEVRLWIREMEQIGVRSLGVAAIATIFTGMVLALQTAYSLPGLGVKYYIGTVVSKSADSRVGPRPDRSGRRRPDRRGHDCRARNHEGDRADRRPARHGRQPGQEAGGSEADRRSADVAFADHHRGPARSPRWHAHRGLSAGPDARLLHQRRAHSI